jgi:hypothetical protein
MFFFRRGGGADWFLAASLPPGTDKKTRWFAMSPAGGQKEFPS